MKQSLLTITLLFICMTPMRAMESIDIDKKVLSMGRVASGVLRVEHFTIHNKTDHTVKLFISTDCECSIEAPTRAIIKPRGVYKLPVSLRVISNPEEVLVEDPLTIMVEEPGKEKTILVVRATVLAQEDSPQKDTNTRGFSLIKSTGKKAGKDSHIHLTYFYKPGCIKCEKAWNIISTILPDYPRIKITQFDITRRENILLCEKMGNRLNLPKDQVLRSPALYFATGVLIADDITEKNIRKVIDSRDLALTKPLHKTVTEDRGAVSSLIEKGRNLSAMAVILAGLIDGINPCAFATLIFFISFLQMMKRSRFETAVIGITFTTAVFLTYLGVGLGLFTGIKPLIQFKWITLGFYAISGTVALVLAVMSISDGLKAKRGELKDMSLQLSDNLKKKIHKIISSKSRRGGIVAGTFTIGVLVSLLELGCTGQVYLPIITFILQVPEMRARGVLFLTAYNLAFILPLVIVFIMVFFGIGWQKTNTWFLRNVAKTKAVLGVLFLFLALMIFYNIYTSYIVPAL